MSADNSLPSGLSDDELEEFTQTLLNDKPIVKTSSTHEAKAEKNDKKQNDKYNRINNILIGIIFLLILVMLGYNALTRTSSRQIELYSEIAAEKGSAAAETETNTAITEKININTATMEQLITLDGIGEKKARAILDYRFLNGDFDSIDELLEIDGIGNGIFEKIKDKITV